MNEKRYYVYIISNSWVTVLYIGVTNNLNRRLLEHQTKVFDGFSKRYNINKLLHYEVYSDANEAIAPEKQIKRWGRQKKMNLIKKENPKLKDLNIGL